MTEEEGETRTTRERLVPLGLDGLGIAELRSYIAELQVEICRAEQAITAKQGHRSAADAFFRKS